MAIVLGLGLVVFVSHAVFFWFFTEDDAYIIARYAQQLGQHGSLVFRGGGRGTVRSVIA